MRVGRLHLVLVCLLIAAIVVITVAPSVDLDPTTLGAQQAGVMATAVLLAAVTTLAAVLVPDPVTLHAWWFHPAACHSLALLDFICSRLC